MKSQFISKIRRSKKSGQSILEYVILTSLIGIFCLVGVKSFGERIKSRLKHATDEVSEHISIR